MIICLVFPKLPPHLDGIGDYTAHMAEALVKQGVEVKVLTAQDSVTELPDVEVVHAFSIIPPSGVSGLSAAFRDSHSQPDWVVVQYNPFSYGHWGFNPWLPKVIARLRQEHPHLRVAIMVHEPFVSVERWQFAVMTVWQRWQLWRLGHLADVVFCAIEPWTQTLSSYTAKETPLVSLPVGSNINRSPCSKQEARKDLNIGNDELVVGVFGSTTHRRKGLIRAAVSGLSQTAMNVSVLYVGTDGKAMEDLTRNVCLYDIGPASNVVVSKALRAMDIHLAPYPRGVSARRGSFIASLQHGLPTVSTSGDHTDTFILDSKEDAFVITPDQDSDAYSQAVINLAIDEPRRFQMKTRAEEFHDRHFRWGDIANKMIVTLQNIN